MFGIVIYDVNTETVTNFASQCQEGTVAPTPSTNTININCTRDNDANAVTWEINIIFLRPYTSGPLPLA